MIVEKTFYAVKCDNCGKLNEGYDYSFYSDKDSAIELASESEFYIGEKIHFCSDCHSIDDNDNLIVFTENKQ